MYRWDNAHAVPQSVKKHKISCSPQISFLSIPFASVHNKALAWADSLWLSKMRHQRASWPPPLWHGYAAVIAFDDDILALIQSHNGLLPQQLKTFTRVSSSCNSVHDLADGVLLNEIMVEMFVSFLNSYFMWELDNVISDSSFFGESLKDVRRTVDRDTTIRIHNLGVLLENITSYFQVIHWWYDSICFYVNFATFQEILQTIVLMELPLITAICRDPEGCLFRFHNSIYHVFNDYS